MLQNTITTIITVELETLKLQTSTSVVLAFTMPDFPVSSTMFKFGTRH